MRILDEGRTGSLLGKNFSLFPYLIDSIHVTSVLMSASLTCPLGGIGISPHTPLPPSFTFFVRLASAPLSLSYLSAMSLYLGPISFLSTVWQARQPLALASASLACTALPN